MKCTYIVQDNENNRHRLKSKRGKQKESQLSWRYFISVFILCLKYLMTQIITKRLKVYVPYLYVLTS